MAIIGPYFRKLEKFNMNLSGTAFSFGSPPHNHPRIPLSVCEDTSLNIYDLNKFGNHPNSRNYGPPCYAIIGKVWSFFDRKFIVYLKDVAESNFDVDIFSMSEFSSLFKKENFENALNRMIFSHGNAYASSGLCRLNWRIETYNGIEWVVFENDGRFASGGMYNPCKSVIQTFYTTPISDEHMLCMYFTQVTRKEVNGLTDAFKKLRDTVMQSTEITLSEESTKQKMEVEKAFPNQQYSESLPPYEYELMPFPDEQDIMRAYVQEHGADFVNSMPYKKYSRTIDKLFKLEKEKYYAQVDQILESHLRFKNNT